MNKLIIDQFNFNIYLLLYHLHEIIPALNSIYHSCLEQKNKLKSKK